MLVRGCSDEYMKIDLLQFWVFDRSESLGFDSTDRRDKLAGAAGSDKRFTAP